MSVALLSCTYFGPIQWYQKLYRYEESQIEHCESFVKQTYRNRCIIATTHGTQALTVPIEHGSKLMRDIRISNHGHWRHLHWNALMSAYGESPFFDYYEDDLRPFFDKKWDFLFDFDMAITEKICELLDIQPTIKYTDSFAPLSSIDTHTGNAFSDFREAIRPKNPLPDADFTLKPYYQVYQQKHGFLTNLSILDLLFNMGNEAILYL
ncbi:MAG: WbqC family protein [Prevotella sp.]|nr:WbqC family protein [Prevotella sp.]